MAYIINLDEEIHAVDKKTEEKGKEARRRLHENLQCIRQAMESMNDSEDIIIRLQWQDGDDVKYIEVLAKTSSLWVVAFRKQETEAWIYFETGNKEQLKETDPSILNYRDNDTGCELNVWRCKELLETLLNRDSFQFGLQGNERNQYLICVFLTSEMVRNEVVEAVFCLGRCMWRDFLPIYRNWQMVSKLLNEGETTVIRAKKVKDSMSLEESNDGIKEFHNLYNGIKALLKW